MPVQRKRDDERRNRITKDADKIFLEEGTVPQPEVIGLAGIGGRFYLSLAKSAQAVYYEPSDWVMAELAARLLMRFEETSVNAYLTQFNTIAVQLLVTEGTRRKVALEIHRNADKALEQGAISVSEYKKRLKLAE